MSRPLSRRTWLAATAAVAPLASQLKSSTPDSSLNQRSQSAFQMRQRAAALQNKRALASMKTNGDEGEIPGWAASFSKGLPQNQFGEPQSAAYKAFLAAIKSGKHEDFERIPRSGGRKLNNPQAAFSYTIDGGDSHTFELPPPPSLRSEEIAFDASELYWKALCRDIPFASYESSPLVQQASKHLGVSTKAVFRGQSKGDQAGPYVSQLLLKPIPIGSGKFEQAYRVPLPNVNYLTTVSEWAQIQTGIFPWLPLQYDPTPRYIRNGRDLGEYVHYDYVHQAYVNAALILYNGGPGTILNCNPFKSPNSPYQFSTVQEGFITFGQAEVMDWLGRVTSAALKASYCQKWMVHRRLRPEELGGRIHYARLGKRDYQIHPTLLKSPASDAVYHRTGTYLLPQAYPEGCPLHPSYPAGHAAIAGACSVVLKVCFDESMLLPAPVVPSADGLKLEPLNNFSTTIGSEINKLASNVALGRDWAGIHYRSDSVAGLELGENVAISVLQDLVRTYTEGIKGLTFTRFNGTKVCITPNGEVTSA